MFDDLLRVPDFVRLSDYCGTWCMEPTAFAVQWEALKRIDLAAHVACSKKKLPKLESQTEMVAGKAGRSVAIVSILGTMMKQRSSGGGTSTIQARREIRNAANDPNVSAILLAFDSPGGTSAGTDDLAREVKAATKKKPVWSYVDDLAASAAYWVASQTERIFANSTTALVGSIGTILTVYDESAAAEQAGVKVFNFTTGPLKGAGRPGTAITPEHQDYFQGLVDAVQEEFDKAVKTGRGMSKAELDAVRTGGVFRASRAIDLKLIDGVQTLEKTIQALMAEPDRPAKNGVAAIGLPMTSRLLPMLRN